MPPRPYTMGARAESTASTRIRLLRAALELCTERLTIQVTLDDVAARAGVSVRTLLRHFGDREGLLEAVIAFGYDEIVAERRAPAGDADEALRILLDHYERRGDLVIRLLGQEDDPAIAAITASGKSTHRAWVGEVFAPWLPADGDAREELVDLLVVSTDVYAWKLLRRDRGRSRAAVEARIRRLVRALLAEAPDAGDRGAGEIG